jgi:hypothetical protein
MADQYHLDLEGFSLESFRHILETSELLPSRRILKEKISERFAILESMGIRNLKELTDALSTKKKIERFSQESGLPQDYLTILKRQTKIYTPNPIPLKDIPGIAPEYIERLAALGLKQTKQRLSKICGPLIMCADADTVPVLVTPDTIVSEALEEWYERQASH